jgi:putative ABC transport system permease protein
MGMFVGILFLSSLGNKLEEDFYITDPYVDFNTALFATIMLIIFGGIAGFIPARRAAKIKPIEALNDK